MPRKKDFTRVQKNRANVHNCAAHGASPNSQNSSGKSIKHGLERAGTLFFFPSFFLWIDGGQIIRKRHHSSQQSNFINRDAWLFPLPRSLRTPVVHLLLTLMDLQVTGTYYRERKLPVFTATTPHQKQYHHDYATSISRPRLFTTMPHHKRYHNYATEQSVDRDYLRQK